MLSLSNYYEEDTSLRKYLNVDDIYKVHHEIARLGATYPNELARNLYLNRETVSSIIKHLIEEGAVEKINLNPNEVPGKIWKRISEFWKKGIIGFRIFSRMTWVQINPDIYWGHKKEFKDE